MANNKKHYRVTVPVMSGLPDDSPTFDFTFAGAGGGVVNDATVVGLLQSFFDGANVNHPLAAYMGALVDRTTNWSVTGTDITDHLDGSPAGPPNFFGAFPVVTAASTGFPLPREVSVCIPHHALDSTITEFGPSGSVIPSTDAAIDQGAPATHLGRTRPKSRYRGRIYFGPLNIDCVDAAPTTLEPVVKATMLADIGTAAHRLVVDGTTASMLWSVWSRRDAIARTVVGGWVTEEFASSRRRRLEPTSKVVWP